MENEKILEMLASLKESIVNLKAKNNDLVDHYKQLKEYNDGVQLQLDNALKENEELKQQLTSLQKQSQEDLESEKLAKDNFMQELTKAIEDAKKVLVDENAPGQE